MTTRRGTNSSKGVGNLSAQRRKRIDRYLIDKYGPICQWCFTRIDRSLPINHTMCWSRDHIISVRNGGSNRLENFQPMHKRCNELKSLEEHKN